ncbi:MAG: hypothetical protein ISS63_16500 [Desulfobacteraceae bacterium]|nr:hypothetical protein [Desulfobacteraceae bacterium]
MRALLCTDQDLEVKAVFLQMQRESHVAEIQEPLMVAGARVWVMVEMESDRMRQYILLHAERKQGPVTERAIRVLRAIVRLISVPAAVHNGNDNRKLTTCANRKLTTLSSVNN